MTFPVDGPPPDVPEHATVAVPVQPEWHGAGVTGERGTREDLRNAMIEAQRQVADTLMSLSPVEMHVRWEVSASEDVNDALAHDLWNPQVGVPSDARWLICTGWCR